MSKFLLTHFFKRHLSAFRLAIINNDTEKIRQILTANRNYLHKQLDTSGNTALLLAVQCASPSTVRLLLQQGARPDQTDFLHSQTALGFLAAKVDDGDRSYNKALALEKAVILLDYGADVNKASVCFYQDQRGETRRCTESPLMTAVRTRNLAMAALLIRRKAQVNYVDQQTQTRPIHLATINGDVAMFRLLEKAGASCRSATSHDKNTLLHWFCSNRDNDQHISILKRLIEKGCDVDAVNADQQTPFMLAANYNMLNTCHLLLNARTNRRCSGQSERTSLNGAKTKANDAMVSVDGWHSKKRRENQANYLPSVDVRYEAVTRKYQRMFERLVGEWQRIN